jgi:hypothetical protein
MARLTKTLIFLVGLVSLMACVQAITTFPITVDHATDTSIVWNLSAMPANPVNQSVYIDGILTSSTIPPNNIIIQSNLKSGEWHSISVTADTLLVVYQGSNTTVTTNTRDSAVWNFVYIYFFALITVLLILCGMGIARIFYLGGFVTALIGVSMNIQPTILLNFTYITFWIYIALILISLVFLAVNPSKGD